MHEVEILSTKEATIHLRRRNVGAHPDDIDGISYPTVDECLQVGKVCDIDTTANHLCIRISATDRKGCGA